MYRARARMEWAVTQLHVASLLRSVSLLISTTSRPLLPCITFSTPALSFEPGANDRMGSFVTGGTRTAGDVYSLRGKRERMVKRYSKLYNGLMTKYVTCRPP